MQQAWILRYGELGLKSRIVRRQFQRALSNNMEGLATNENVSLVEDRIKSMEVVTSNSSAYEVEEISYDIDDNQKEDFLNSIRKYWPNLDEENLNPDYSGIRGLVDGSNDFVIEAKHFDSNLLVDVLGYVSPGLTASLATAKYVKKLLNNFT